MEFYPRNEQHARRELEAQLNLFDPAPVAEVEEEQRDADSKSAQDFLEAASPKKS